MTDGPALLKAVIANPDEDTPRLVYADWLDENGEEARAEFIRSQVQLAGMNAWDEGFTELDIRCRELERAHPEWVEPVGAFVQRGEVFSGDRDYPFQRGFPRKVRVTAGQFADYRRDILKGTPARHVEFELDDGHVRLAKLSGLSWLTAVDFAYVRSPGALRTVLACLERFDNLKHFGIIGSSLPASQAERVFASGAVGGVQSLLIQGTRLPDAAEATLTGLDWPPLRKLVRKLVTHLDWLRAPWVAQLHELTIYDSEPLLTAGQTRLLADILPDTELRK
ncbi:MAG: TIGR02996 domain-containing protein, partial [Gemmataceae bacterium]|nr:TIGR02996 domain-containing protein [Gemmataceae bacterium]